MTEFIKYKSHTALIILQEMILNLFHTVSEYYIAVGFFTFMNRKKYI